MDWIADEMQYQLSNLTRWIAFYKRAYIDTTPLTAALASVGNWIRAHRAGQGDNELGLCILQDAENALDAAYLELFGRQEAQRQWDKYVHLHNQMHEWYKKHWIAKGSDDVWYLTEEGYAALMGEAA